MSERTAYEWKKLYDEHLDDVHGVVTVAGYDYDTSRVLKDTDRTAYEVGLSDFIGLYEEGEDNE